jgi:hypothetical protein
MEIIWLVLAILLCLGICIAYWQKGVQASKPRVSPKRKLPQQASVKYQPHTPLSPTFVISKNQDFRVLKSQLEELANRGWAKNESFGILCFL